MNKKLICLTIALLMIFSKLVACNDFPKRLSLGRFESLQEAYNKNLLNEQDLKSIAYYHGCLDDSSGTFVATPKEPDTLSVETSNKIC
jgi:hypothetical protein